MNKLKKKIRNAGITVLSVSTFALLSFGLIGFSPNKDFALSKNMDIFFSLIREINLFYVDEQKPDKLITDAINGVIDGLDPYTAYIPETEKENFATMTTGRYGGIGAIIRQVGEYVMVIEPYENFPAQKSGLRAGDIIIAVNGVSTKGRLVTEVSEMLKGSPDSELELTIKRNEDDTPLVFKLTREEVKIDNVTWYGMVDQGIGYMQFTGFTENAHYEVRDALKDLTDNHEVNSLILDVRGNPGGLLLEAVKVMDLFVEKGEAIVSTRGKVKQWDHIYKARSRAYYPEIKIVVLAGRGSASAAEIVAGAMQDLDRGVVIGNRTFGKGLIQTTRQLSFDAQLKITTAKYYTPSGRCIQAIDFNSEGGASYIPDSLINEFRTKNGRIVYDGGGIIPDIEVEEKETPPLVISLYASNHIFNFATKYASENRAIPPVRLFSVTDELYSEFKKYLDKNNFTYQTQTERKFSELISVAKQENYYNLSNELFDNLGKRITSDKSIDLELYKEEIKALLREEIISRYYYQRGRTEASISGDPYIEKAINMLNNRLIYESILDGTFKNTEDRGKYPFSVNRLSHGINNAMITC
jgi:carboxyl-terminal processing protease